jgi:FKBP-type peptidyl-prolyl cis-trans isomerase 2
MVVVLGLLFVGCSKQEEELLLNEQEAAIETYVEALDEESYVEVVVENGVWRVVLDYGANNEGTVEESSVEGGFVDVSVDSSPVEESDFGKIGFGADDIGAEAGDSLVFDYAAYVFQSGKGMFFATSLPDLAESMGVSRDPGEYVPQEIVLGRDKIVSGLEKGLSGVKEGEHCYVIFSARHGFGNTHTGVVPELSALMYEVWVKRVKKD